MRIALIGQPNCGKSTLFNQVAGYKAETGNFAGTSVTFIESKVRVMGEVVTLVDLPGTYTLAGTNPAERESLKYLTSNQVDVIINVVDSTHLAQGLQLTLELRALNRPLVVALNMLDEAETMGLQIDGPGLQEILGVPVLPLIASKGRGIQSLFLRALENKGKDPVGITSKIIGTDALSRHKRAEELSEQIVKIGEARKSWRNRLDDILLHPVWGYFVLIGVLFLFFWGVYGLGSAIEGPVLAFFDRLSESLTANMNSTSLWTNMLVGVIQGISGGIAIVLPYLIPFLLGLGLLEDVGYLPRIAFLMDGLMHRIGLHGKAIVPFILGYGCNVPSVMSTRILEERRDRILAATLAVLVPCAARLSVVFGLVAFYLGPVYALAIYLFNIFVIAFLGKILNRLIPEDSPGLILEMPIYHLPTLRSVVNKTWFRVREFVFEAWPLLIAGSAVMAVLNFYKLSLYLNIPIRPITWLLGLPSETGVPLIFGILRKELSLIMLRQALGVADFSAALTSIQMVTFSVFVVFYIPCLATLSMLRKEFGWKSTFKIAGFTVVVALAAGLIARGLFFLVEFLL